MAGSVLDELDQLRSLLSAPRQAPAQQQGALPPDYSLHTGTCRTYGSAMNTAEKGANRLGRAIEAAEEEMEAALQRTADMHRAQLRQREGEVAELKRVVAARDQALDGLRATLTDAKRGYEGRLAALESMLAARESEAAGLQAEVLALRTEREELEGRLHKGLSSLSRAEHELQDRTHQLASSLAAKTQEATAVAGTAQRERKEKDMLLLEVGELKGELEAVEEELARSREETAHALARGTRECEVRRDTEVALEKARAQAEFVRESKDLEVAELQRRLKAERGVRKACERWLKAELRSREEMEGLLVAVRDMATGRGDTGAAAAHMQQVEGLIAGMAVRGRAEAAGAGAGAAREFAAMKGALAGGSAQLRAELDAAKAVLAQKLGAVGL